MRALSIAATGMSAQQTNVEVIANNIANVNTSGFKRSRAEFTDLLYQADRIAGGATRARQTVPEGTEIGLGVRPAAVRSLNLQGALSRTGNPLDLAINGKGWFQLAGADGEVAYARAGSLGRNADGDLVNVDGRLLQPRITIPADASEIVVGESGTVSVRSGNAGQLRQIGQILIARFANEAGLGPLGGNLHRVTEASGPAVVGVPGEAGAGALQQGYLEQSNVDAVREITELIAAQRAYEMNSKVIQAADEMYGTISKGLR